MITSAHTFEQDFIKYIHFEGFNNFRKDLRQNIIAEQWRIHGECSIIHNGEYFCVHSNNFPTVKLNKTLYGLYDEFVEFNNKASKDHMYCMQYMYALISYARSQNEVLELMPDDFKPRQYSYNYFFYPFKLSPEKFADIIKLYKGFDLL